MKSLKLTLLSILSISGVQIFTRYRRTFFQADAQFTLRGDGRYS